MECLYFLWSNPLVFVFLTVSERLTLTLKVRYRLACKVLFMRSLEVVVFMTKRLLTVTLGGMLLPLLSSANRQLAQGRPITMAANYGSLPMSFEPNRGQFDTRFAFGARAFNYSLLLSSKAVMTKFSTTASNSETLEMTLLGANDSARLYGADRCREYRITTQATVTIGLLTCLHMKKSKSRMCMPPEMSMPQE